jgi:hypothetical protein
MYGCNVLYEQQHIKKQNSGELPVSFIVIYITAEPTFDALSGPFHFNTTPNNKKFVD